MITVEQVISIINKEIEQSSFYETSYTQSFDRYFELNYKQEYIDSNYYGLNRDKYVISFSINLKNSDAILTKLEIEFFVNGSYDAYLREFINDRYLAKAMLNYAISKKIESGELLRDIDLKIKDILANKKTAYKLAFTKAIDNELKNIEQIEILQDLPKIHITPSIEKDAYNRIILNLKIGRDKMYVVANIATLISRFESKATHKYGKNLSFVHDYSALDESSLNIIRRLSQIYENLREGDRFISANIAKDIINFSNGQYIDIQYEGLATYYVNLTAINPTIYIDKDYVMHLESDLNIRYFLGFALDVEKRELFKLYDDEQLSNLATLISNSEYPCVEDMIDDFKYVYYLKYPDYFRIDPRIIDEFRFDDLLINAYFDFDNKMITVKEDLYLNSKPIKADELNKYTSSQYRKYQSILKAFGFEDNKLIDQANIWNFFNSSLENLKKYATIYLSDSILNKNVSSFQNPNIRINYNNGLLDVFLEDSRYSDEELFLILDALKKKKKYILFKDQMIGLDNKNTKQFFENATNYQLLDKKAINRRTKLPIYYAFKALDDSNGISLNEQIFEIFDSIKNFKSSDFKAGKINGILRPYQIEGIKWLDILYKNYLNGVLADDMGLGKTIEIISFLKGEKIKGNCLIVCPKTLLFNWQNEFAKFAPNMKVVPIYGIAENRENIISKINLNKETIYLTGYESLRRDEDLYKDIIFDTVILDEAQYIKNSKAKKSISIYNLKCDHRFALTGTPIENSILDLWSIFNFLMPNYLLDITEFKSRYETEADYVKKVRKLISPFILRRNKVDVLNDLPDKFETIVSCDMSEGQRKIYDAHILEAKRMLEQENNPINVLYALTRLRQICIDPSLFVENYHGGSGKLDVLIQLINDRLENGHRILIFSQFVMALTLVEEKLKELGISYFKITGETNGLDRVELANEFNNTKKYKIGLISLKAGGTGLNLIGADTVIHLDPWWNVAAQNQATDRAHRIGQERNVEVIKLICDNSIEQRVVELQNIKKDLIDKVISNSDKSITNLSIEDINFILRSN